jgi:glycosyltransferase involved in cell wall biosynthesis
MAEADAEVYVVRAANAAVGVAAAFCEANGRGFVYASAGNADFARHPTGAPGWRGDVFRWGVRRADALVVQSGDQARMAAQRFPSVSPVHEIPSFVEEVPGDGPPAQGFLWAARLADYKRPMEYVRLARAVPEARFWMVAVPTPGDTTPELEIELTREARGVPNLEVLPGQTHAEMLALSARAVAIVNTSSTEGMPNTFLEGWAAGVPALSLEFDPDGRIAARGLGVAAAGSFEAFAEGARRLWNERADRAGMGPAVRAYIQENHGLDSVGSRWAAVIAEAAAR